MKRCLYLLIAVFVFLPCAYAQDLIHLKDGLKIEGLVEGGSETFYKVTVDKEGTTGYILLDKTRVVSIEYDYEQRLSKIKDDDWRGHYQLGVFCFQNGMTGKAISELSAIAGKKDVPIDSYLYLARAFISHKRYNEARDALRNYLKKVPNDADAKKLLHDISKKQDVKSATASTDPDPATETVSTETSPQVTQDKKEPPAETSGTEPAVQPAVEDAGDILEGLEAEAGWKYAWGNRLEADVFKLQDSKNTLLRIKFEGGDEDKTTVRKVMKTDFRDKKFFKYDAYNPTTTPFSICFAVVTCPGWVYHESPQIILKPDWNLNNVIDLTASTFKTEKSGWKFTSPITNMDDVRQIFFVVYNGKKDGTLFMDYIRTE